MVHMGDVGLPFAWDAPVSIMVYVNMERNWA